MALTIWDLKANPWSGDSRYYSPGQHPGTARMRKQLAEAERLRAVWTHRGLEHGVKYDTEQLDEFVEYLREQLMLFEARESDLKARDDWMLRAR